MREPDQSVIDQVKSKFPDREISLISMPVGDEEYFFIVTAPERADWNKYHSELKAADGAFDKLEKAIEIAALAQIRWPERDQVRDIFNKRPGLIQNFASPLRDMAGANTEARVKKL